MSEDNRYYFDTSALLPYYRQEKASITVEKLLCSISPPVLISDLTRAGLYLHKSLGSTCYQQAEKWLSMRKTPMRTLDALHLACSTTSQATMVTCDVVLHQSAEMFGVPSLLIK